MNKQEFNSKIYALRKHTELFKSVIDVFLSTMTPPIMYDSGLEHFGFRYMKTSVKHFCVLKAVRSISGLNASIVLAESGYSQEIGVLVRTIIECNTQIEFVLAGLDEDALDDKAQKVLTTFFEDYKRNSSADFKGSQIRQEDVHTKIGQFLDDVLEIESIDQFANTRSKELMSNVYKTFSNYVHARYPEIMDMYGGTPGNFHMSGMPNTPKDLENLLIIEAFRDSVALALRMMVLKLGMSEAVAAHPIAKDIKSLPN